MTVYLNKLPRAVLALLVLGPATLRAAAPVTQLDPLTVASPRVANQAPGGTFAMPVSVLRYEPRVDLQARNLVEGQADLTLRGGTFESTGWALGAVSLGAPQTGHYLAELPVDPAMLTPPQLLFVRFTHLQPLQFPALLAFGVILGVLAWRTGRLGPALWAHVGFNVVAAAGLLYNFGPT